MPALLRICRLPLALALLAFTLRPGCVLAASSSPGEFSQNTTLPLNTDQRARLKTLVEKDPEAAALFAELGRSAVPLLDRVPRPLAAIHYAGLVNTDPRRIATVEKLREMADVATLLNYWQASSDDRAAATLRRFVTAWASTYQPDGNDVNENKLYPALVAYDALRNTFSPSERERIDAWIARLAAPHLQAVRDSTRLNNRYTKHVRLLAICARILGRPDWTELAVTGVERFVAESLRADGTSLDLEMRDTLTYHTSALRPVIEIAVIAGPERGLALYVSESSAGASIKKSVDYVRPYASGEKTREEWRNTTVPLDRERAAAGLEAYRPGRLYEPKDALRVLEEASYFDASLTPLVLKLAESRATRFATWTMVLNAAAR